MYPILAIDVGSVFFGLAVCDFKGQIATGLKVLKLSDHSGFDRLINDILDSAERYRVKTILVGKPQVMHDSHKASRERIDKFIKLLRERTEKPILITDESYSTVEATNILQDQGLSASKIKKKIDAAAAASFLQDFLDRLNRDPEFKKSMEQVQSIQINDEAN